MLSLLMKIMTYDCIIIGGGVAGSSAAFTMAKAGLRVIVIDRESRTPKQKIGESLSGQGIHLLKSSRLFNWVQESRPIENTGNISAWGSSALVQKDFIFDLFGSGWHLDRAAFDRCLQKAALSKGSVFLNEKVRYLERARTSGWNVQLQDREIHSRWLIDASGRNGVVSKYLGIKRIKDSPLIAIFSWGVNRSSESRTLIETTPNGWWYTALLPDNRRVAAFHTSPAHAKSLIQGQRHFADEMRTTRHVSQHCCLDESWTSLRGADASGSILATTAGEDWLAIGDAAMTFDPLSAHGILNALAHGIFGAQAIIKAFSGDFDALRNLKEDVLNKRREYVKNIMNLYNNENRWENSFWRAMNAYTKFNG
ncbi:FAD-binding protein [Brucella sp. 10RB9210]|nr:FAD-binding protein [Brucella sp. 10RB9210]